MYGYADDGLLLLPKVESYEHRSETYHLDLRKAVNNLLSFCEIRKIQLKCFVTDEVAVLLNPKGVEWILTVPKEDYFFIRTNCDNMGKEYPNLISYNDLYTLARKKFPVEEKLNREQRFDVVLQREHFVTKKIIEKFKFVINIFTPNNAAYSVEPKEGDDKIILHVHNGNFIINGYINGYSTDIIDLLDLVYANRPLHTWKVENENENILL
ncbi:MAG: hypothetical protein LBS29_04905 [Endomicrobium sp.]|jgi:hypothetical protein|nr:hypothetical protein [Endomicrobium sp.]